MKKSLITISKIVIILLAVQLIGACSKNSDFIKGDSKIRFFHTAVTDTAQIFYINGVKQGAAAQYNTSTSYIIVPGDSVNVNTISARDIDKPVDSVTTNNLKFLIGKNYSAYFTKTKKGEPGVFKFYEDSVKIDVDSAKLAFINLGYTLGSDVIVSDAGKAFPDFTVKYGERLNRKIKVTTQTSISFLLKTIVTNPPPVTDTLRATGLSPITNGKTYTIVLDGTKKGDLHTRLVGSN